MAVQVCQWSNSELKLTHMTNMTRQYTLVIDKSGSMSSTDMPGGKSRWDAMQENTLALARKIDQFDPDGVTVYVFSGSFKRYDNVTASTVETIFAENDPSGSTALHKVLEAALSDWASRRPPEGETILVVTDGEPDDRKAVMKLIIEYSREMNADEELAISFIQIGSAPEASRFLKVLDDELQGAGAKFDIVDTVTQEDMDNLTLQEVLLKAIAD
jgi:hypothetical protein